MSGTSLDGLDIACVLFSHNTEQVDFVLEAAETVPLPTPLKERLLRIEEQSPRAIFKLNAELGRFYAEAVNSFLASNNLKKESIKFYLKCFI